MVADTLPLFPLGTVLMPGMSLPLHIFEPRYRQLTIDLVTGTVPNREFGVIAIREGWLPDNDGMEGLHRVGCTAQLRDVRKLPDGRFDVVTAGGRRFRLLEVDDESRPYMMGTVAWLPDVDDPDTPPENLDGLADAAKAAHARYCETAWRAGDWDRPSMEATTETLAHLLAADCLLPMRDRQLLLEQTNPTTRLRLIRILLAREAALLSELRAVPTPLSSFAVEHSDN